MTVKIETANNLRKALDALVAEQKKTQALIEALKPLAKIRPDLQAGNLVEDFPLYFEQHDLTIGDARRAAALLREMGVAL